MKRITKRIMALMLSLVMVFGCIPCFISDSSANEIASIADLMAITNNFPDSMNNGWKSENGYIVYYDNALNFLANGSLVFYGSDVLTLTKNGDDYENTSLHLKFIMTNNQLTSIVCNEEGYEGTYNPELINTVELEAVGVLATNVQSLKYEKVDGIGYELTDDGKWYQENLTETYDFSSAGIAYKKLIATAEKGYMFSCPTVSFTNEYGQLVNIPEVDTEGILEIIIKKDVVDDFSKTATITLPTTPGTTVQQIIDNISITTTETFDTVVIDSVDVKEVGSTDNLTSDAVLENNKEYLVSIRLTDAEFSAYTAIKVNNTVLDQRAYTDPDVQNNHFMFPFAHQKIAAYYKFVSKPVSSGSKKYKATDNNDTAEKITGTGKKGSQRTIVPEEGRKVASVIVTDKDGNRIDVTLNEDGTYSFTQPASNVNVEVNYKNREITLNIGSTDASVDGEHSNLDVAPVIRNDRTMLPIRFVAENLGAKVEWSEKNSNYVVITRGDTKIEITLGSDIMKVNGKDVKLDSVAFAENDRTYLPVRAVSEALNAIVEWNESKPNEVKIYER